MTKSTLTALGALLLCSMSTQAQHSNYGPFATAFSASTSEARAYYRIISDRAADGGSSDAPVSVTSPCLTIADNDYRQITYDTDERLQYWEFEAVGDGSYYVRNAVTGEYWNAGTAPNKKGYGVCAVTEITSAQPYFIIDLANQNLGSSSFEAGSFGFSTTAFESLSATDRTFIDAANYGDYSEFNDYTQKNFTICANEWYPWGGGNSDNGSVYYFAEADAETVTAAYNDYYGIEGPDPEPEPEPEPNPEPDPILETFIPVVTPGAGRVEALTTITIALPADERYAAAALAESFTDAITLSRAEVEEPIYTWGIDDVTAAETYDADGNTTWNLAVEITAPSTYTLTIPAGLFIAYDETYTTKLAANGEITVEWILAEDAMLQEVTDSAAAKAATTYDLLGRRVTDPRAAGLYIVDGRLIRR